MYSLTGCVSSAAKRMSRLVRMPTSSPSAFVIGTPYGDAEFNVRMAGFGLALTLDYGARFNGLLRFGVAQVQATWQAPWAWPAESRSTSAEGYYGLTLGYMLAPNLAAELSFDGTRYEAGDRVDRVDALTLGLSLRF
mgnify:CR=1 FL=1